MKIEDPIRRVQCAASSLRHLSQAKGDKIFFKKPSSTPKSKQITPKGELAQKQADSWATLLVPDGLQLQACFHRAIS